MKLRKLLYTITGIIDAIIKPLGWVIAGVVVIMVLVVAGNVFGRFFFHKPLMGTIELVELMMVIIAFLAIAYTASKRAHLRIELVVSRLPRRTQAILSSIAFFLFAAIFAVIAYEGSLLASYYIHHPRETSFVLSIPLAPFRIVMALGCALLSLRMLVEVFHSLLPEGGQKGGSSK